MKQLKIGELRFQSALPASDTRVVLKPGPKLRALLREGERIVLTRSYPDTVNELGNWGSCFKIDAEVEG